MTPRKGYSDGPCGQIHWRIWGIQTGNPDLYCLHPAPLSSLAFTDLAPLLAQDRRVIAPDYPGHGGSHAYTETPSISDYAAAVVSVISDLSHARKPVLLGFHTGCLVASALNQEAHSLILIDVPAFDPDTRATYLPITGAPPELGADLTCVEKMWQQSMIKRLAAQGLDAAFNTFIDHIQHGRAMHAGFHAAFSCDVESLFATITAPTTIIATQSVLLEPSRRAAKLIAHAIFREELEITGSVLNQSSIQTAQAVARAMR